MNITRRCILLTLYILGIFLIPHAHHRQATLAAQSLSPSDWQSIQGLLPLNEQAFLRGSDTNQSHHFGYSVDIDGTTAVVGAVGATLTNDSFTVTGAVYIFERNPIDPTIWTEQAVLRSSNIELSDGFGAAVAIKDNTLIVGAPGEDGIFNSLDSTGAIYVFERDPNDPTIWNEQALLRTSNAAAGDRFGTTIAFDGETIAVGNPGKNDIETGDHWTGATYIFVKDGTTWTEQAFLQPDDLIERDRFGTSVAINGNTLAVGVPHKSKPNANNSITGAVYIFQRTGTNWTQQTILLSETHGSLGYSVALDGTTLAIGTPTAAHIFIWNGAGWVEQTILEDADGPSIDLQGDLLITGSDWQDIIHVFERNGTIWTQQAQLQGSHTGKNDHFGRSLALDGTTILVGAPDEAHPDDSSMLQAGAAYIFEQAITVDAGFDRLVTPNEPVTLQGNANSNSTMSYEWTQLSGTDVALTDALSLTASFTAPTETLALDFQLTVTNTYGLTATDTVTIRLATHKVYLPLVRRPTQ